MRIATAIVLTHMVRDWAFRIYLQSGRIQPTKHLQPDEMFGFHSLRHSLSTWVHPTNKDCGLCRPCCGKAYPDAGRDSTPTGYIPTYEQADHALLVGPQGGKLVRLPLLPPALNRLIRIAHLKLSADGTLSGTVMESYWGGLADARRKHLLDIPEKQRVKTVETFLTSFLPGLVLRGIKIGNLNDPSHELLIAYSFLAKGYAQPMGDLLLLRPPVLGEKSMDLTQSNDKKRQYPVELSSTSLESGIIQITLPPGYRVVELPADEDFHPAFGEYKVRVSVEKNVLHYTRTFQITRILIPAAQIDSLKTFFQRVSRDERSFAILRRTVPTKPPPS